MIAVPATGRAWRQPSRPRLTGLPKRVTPVYPPPGWVLAVPPGISVGAATTLTALIEALYWDRHNADAWSELVDLASAAPHVPTLLALYARVPSGTRAGMLPQLLSMSEQRDRLGRLNPAQGERLRDGLLDLAESQGDTATVATLTGYAGLAAEKAGDLDAAVRWWRRAITAGSTDAKVADRFSIWLVKGHAYEEPAQVLQQALAADPGSAEIAERMQHRLARCQRNSGS